MINQLHEIDIEGKRVANYRFNVYADYRSGCFKQIDVIWVIATTKEIARQMARGRAKEMYDNEYPECTISVMATN